MLCSALHTNEGTVPEQEVRRLPLSGEADLAEAIDAMFIVGQSDQSVQVLLEFRRLRELGRLNSLSRNVLMLERLLFSLFFLLFYLGFFLLIKYRCLFDFFNLLFFLDVFDLEGGLICVGRLLVLFAHYNEINS